MISPVRIRKCTPEDLDELRDFAQTVFVEAFGAENSAEDMDLYIKKAFSRERMRAELSDSESAFYAAFIENIIVGYLKLNVGAVQTEMRDPKAIEIERIYVAKAYRSQKIGRLLLDKTLEIARNTNVNYIWLGVWEKNDKAIRFYEANGFKQFGTHPYQLGNDMQTDWLMKLELK